MSTKLHTKPEAAEILRVPVSTLNYWRANGEGPPAVKIGKRVLYRDADLEAFINDQMKTA